MITFFVGHLCTFYRNNPISFIVSFFCQNTQTLVQRNHSDRLNRPQSYFAIKVGWQFLVRIQHCSHFQNELAGHLIRQRNVRLNRFGFHQNWLHVLPPPPGIANRINSNRDGPRIAEYGLAFAQSILNCSCKTNIHMV